MSTPACLAFAFNGYSLRAFSQARKPTGELPPPVPLYEGTQTAYGFGAANHIEAADQRGVILPAGASALPAVTDDWVQGFFFSVEELREIVQVCRSFRIIGSSESAAPVAAATFGGAAEARSGRRAEAARAPEAARTSRREKGMVMRGLWAR